MRTAYILTVFLMLALCSTGCRSPQYIPYPVEKVVHDSVFVNRMSRDSVYRRDSIYVDRTGDTVYIYRDKYLYLYRDRTDTLFRDRVKTVREAYLVPVGAHLSRRSVFGIYYRNALYKNEKAMKVTVMQGQSLVDIAMQVYGSAEGVFALAKENGLSVTDEVSPGQVLTYDPGNVVEKSVSDYYDTNGVRPVTAFVNLELVFDETFDNTFRSFDRNEQNS